MESKQWYEIWDQVKSQICYHSGLHLLNTTIVPTDGDWRIVTIPLDRARHCVAAAVQSHTEGFGIGLVSHVGHESTAQLLTTLMGTEVVMDRTPWQGDGVGLALQVAGRPPEGKVLDLSEIEALGYTLRLLYRVTAPAALGAPQGRTPDNPKVAELARRMRNIAQRVEALRGGDMTSLVMVGESPDEQGRARYVTCQQIADLLDTGDAVKDALLATQ